MPGIVGLVWLRVVALSLVLISAAGRLMRRASSLNLLVHERSAEACWCISVMFRRNSVDKRSSATGDAPYKPNLLVAFVTQRGRCVSVSGAAQTCSSFRHLSLIEWDVSGPMAMWPGPPTSRMLSYGTVGFRCLSVNMFLSLSQISACRGGVAAPLN